MTSSKLIGQMNLRKTEFKWEIDNIHCILNQDNNLLSPEFTVDGFTWQLEMYTKVNAKAFSDYVSIFLQLKNDMQCTTNYSLSIIANDQSQCNQRISGIRNYSLSSGSWGILKFIRHQELIDKENQYLSDDKLIILLELYPNRYNVSNVLPIDFESILSNKQFCDVQIIVKNMKDQLLYGHKSILSKKSEVFAAMFEHDMKENIENTVCIEDIDHQVLVEMLRFIYTGEVKNIENIAEELLIVADKYAIVDLKDVCSDYFFHSLSSDNAIHYLDLASRYHSDTLKHNTKKYILSNIKGMVGTSEFRSITDLQSEDLLDIICSLVSKLP